MPFASEDPSAFARIAVDGFTEPTLAEAVLGYGACGLLAAVGLLLIGQMVFTTARGTGKRNAVRWLATLAAAPLLAFDGLFLLLRTLIWHDNPLSATLDARLTFWGLFLAPLLALGTLIGWWRGWPGPLVAALLLPSALPAARVGLFLIERLLAS